MKSFSDFKQYLADNGSEILSSIEQQTQSYLQDPDSGSISYDRAETHFELLEFLERYHIWLHS